MVPKHENHSAITFVATSLSAIAHGCKYVYEPKSIFRRTYALLSLLEAPIYINWHGPRPSVSHRVVL